MTTVPSLLSPALLHAAAVFIVGLMMLQVAAFTSGVALVAPRTSLPRRARLGVPLVVAAALAAWLAWAVLAVPAPVVTPEAPSTGVQNLGLLLEMGAFEVIAIAALWTSRSLRAFCAATPPAWLIGFQTYRVAGVIFLWPFLASGALPPAFALLAGVGDMLTGLGAPFVALGLARGAPRARARAVAWNLFGMLDFAVAVTAAVLSHSTNIGRFPLVVFPLFVVPVGMLVHLYSLRTLAASREPTPVDGVSGSVPQALY